MNKSVRLLSCTILGGILMGAPAQSKQAYAQSEASLKPVSGWAVTRINDDQSGSGPYCTLSRQYEDDVIFTLGQNKAKEYSLAVDFQTSTFDSDKAYQLSLQPGPGQMRAYEIMPASESAVVVRLGWDESFFDALNNSQTLKTAIGAKKISLHIPELSEGQQDLSACVESFDVADAPNANAGQPQDVLTAEPGATSRAFSARKVAGNKVEAEQAAKIEPAAGDQPENKEEKATATAKKLEPTPLVEPRVSRRVLKSAELESGAVTQDKNNAGSEELVVLRQENQRLRSALEAERERLKEAVKQAGPDNRVTALQEKVSFLESENQTLKQQTQGKEAQKSAQAQELKAQFQQEINALKAENAQLKSDLEAQQKAAAKGDPEQEKLVASLQARINKLENENGKLLEDVRKARSAADNAVIQAGEQALVRVKDLQSRLDSAKADNVRMAKRLEELTKAQEESVLGAAAGDWDLEQATKRFNEAEREIQRLGLMLEQERMNCRREKADLEQMLFDPAVADKQQIQRLMTLESQLKEAQAKIGDQEKLIEQAVQKRTASLKEQNQSLQAKVQDSQGRISSLTQLLASEKDRAEKLAGDLSAQQSRLSAVSAQLEKEKAEPDIDPAVVEEARKLRGQVESLEKQLAEEKGKPEVPPRVQSELRSLKTNLSAAKQEAQAQKSKAERLEANLSENQARLAALSAQLEKEKAEPDIDPAVVEEARKLRGQVASLQQKLAEEREKPNIPPQVQSELQSLKESLAAAKQEVQAQKAKAGKLEASLSEKQARLSAASNELKEMKAEPEIPPKVMQDLKVLTSQRDTLRDQNVELNKQLTELQQDISGFKRRSSGRETEVDSLKREVSSLKSELQTLRGQAHQVSSEAQQSRNLQQELQQARQEISALRRDNRVLEDTLNSRIQPAAGQEQSRSYLREASASSQPSSDAAPVQKVSLNVTTADIQNMLSRAGIVLNSGIQKSGQGQYSWRSDNLRGTALVMTQAASGNFARNVNAYIQKAKSNCRGDFASVPSQEGNGFASYEIACVNGQTSSTSSVVFFKRSGEFVAIAHETSAEDMDFAMDARDKLASQIMSTL